MGGNSILLAQAGARFVREFEAPVSKPYSLLLDFDFPSLAAIRADGVVGSGYHAGCDGEHDSIPRMVRPDLGRVIPIHVVVREKQTGTVTLDQVFETLCKTSSSATGWNKTRTAARFHLDAGKYVIVVRNVEGQAGLDGVETTVMLVSEGGK